MKRRTLNDFIFQFWENRCTFYDLYGCRFLMEKHFRPVASKILMSAGILEWTQIIEDHLTATILNYSPTRCRPFWVFYAEKFCNAFKITAQQADAIRKAALTAEKGGK